LKHHNLLIGCAALTLLESSATAATHADQTCKKVKAEIVATPLVNGCTSAFGLCTAGTIDGNQGLHGTTHFVADGVTPSPATAPDDAATVAYSGIIHITTRDGTLDVRDTGIFDTASGTAAGGLFASFDRIEGGTGQFAGATGTLLIGGKTIDGQLVADVSGEICSQ
jgi:hypothetical protein